MTILFLSTRRDGRSLGQMARDELGPVGGYAALVGTLMIMVILIAVLGLVIVNAMKHSPWATSTVFATIPIAMLVGLYMRNIRPGRVLEGSLIGFSLLLLAVVGGGWIERQPALRDAVRPRRRCTLAWFVIGYGFIAAILPVWLLLAPRDYLSTFLKTRHGDSAGGRDRRHASGDQDAGADAVHRRHRSDLRRQGVPVRVHHHRLRRDVRLPRAGVERHHAEADRPTKRDIRLIGYGSMMLESFVAIMAMIAATLLDPGVYFAINSPAGVVGSHRRGCGADDFVLGLPGHGRADARSWRSEMGEKTLFARTGGAPSLAVGMASIFGIAFGKRMLAVWYHFAIMFEAVFILTTLDAGTRVGRFMLQDLLGHVWQPLGQTSWYPSVLLSSAIIVAGWGYFLYIGVIDPNGGVNILWPLFGIANQMLAAIALSVATGILVKPGKLRYAWVTGVPLAWLAIVTTTAAWQKIFSRRARIGFFAGANDLAAKLAAGTAAARNKPLSRRS